MKSIVINIKKAVRQLLLDRSLVHTIRKAKVDKGVLYNQLLSGRITMQEYLRAV